MSIEFSLDDVDALHAQGSLRDIDYYMAGTLKRYYGEANPSVLLAMAMASRVVADGHICLDLEPVAGHAWPDVQPTDGDDTLVQTTTVMLPALDSWIKALNGSKACGSPCAADRPLILVQNGPQVRLYLRRYYQYEQRIAARLKKLAEQAPVTLSDNKRDALFNRLFPIDKANGSHARPREAAQAALAKRLLIISGGPGTGKTHTLARLLVLLVEAGIEQGKARVIRMAAPTGKAAMRMRASIRDAKVALKLKDELSKRIPEDACTLHRLLETRPNSPHSRHHVDNPLPADIVIVDEASMIDLPMMAKLLDALQPTARLILLGDMNQLSSVDPGYVLGDICVAALADTSSPLCGSLVELTHSWRFPADGPVGRLGVAMQRAGDTSDPDGTCAWDTLQKLQGQSSTAGDEVIWHDAPQTLTEGAGHPLKDLRTLILAEYKPFLEASEVEEAFEALGRFRILCALRRGPYGVATLNAMAEEILSLKNMLFGQDDPAQPKHKLNPTGRFYDHRVIMVTRNDYSLRLFNGDVGIILPETAKGGSVVKGSTPRLVAWFEVTDETTGQKDVRPLPCHMLPEHETAFAMTIHKSQGSQFRDILVLLPPNENPLLTKELLYTGITRAEKRVYLWCSEAMFKYAVCRKTLRASGLTAALLT